MCAGIRSAVAAARHAQAAASAPAMVRSNPDIRQRRGSAFRICIAQSVRGRVPARIVRIRYAHTYCEGTADTYAARPAPQEHAANDAARARERSASGPTLAA